MKTAHTSALLAAALIWFVSPAAPALAAQHTDMDACDQAASRASQQSQVPLDVLRAITRTETGHVRNGQFSPWPWTVNMEGKGVWFETAELARAYVYKHYKTGARSFDVGCFQLNHKWHSQAFSSLEEMFDPLANATYAAGFLAQLYAEFGNWDEAVGAYHSRTPKFAQTYKKTVATHLANLKATDTGRTVNTIAPRALRPNGYRLLQSSGAPMSAGSLLMLGQSDGFSLFTAAQPLFGPGS